MEKQAFTVSDACSLLEELRAELLHRNVIVRNLRVAGSAEKLKEAVTQRKDYNVRYGKLYQAVCSYELGRLNVEQLEAIYEQTRIPLSR